MIGDDEVAISIRALGMLEGTLPPAKLRRVLSWREIIKGRWP